MTHLFDNYEKYNTVIPDNRYKFLPVIPEYKDIIIKDAEVEHCFTIPHKIDEIINVKVIYTQGTEEKLIIPFSRIELKDINNEDETTDKDSCQASYFITKDESLLFNNYNKQTQVQLATIIWNDLEEKIEFSPIFKIKVVPTLFTMEDGD